MDHALFEKIAGLIEESRKKVSSAINIAEVYTKYNVGRYIIEHEQEGKYKAAYGKQVLKQLSEKLTNRYGKGWSVETLTTTRKFYQTYSNSVNTVYEIPAEANKSEASKIVNTVYDFQDTTPVTHKFALSWSHYLILMRIFDANARSFYEIECAKQNWSVRWLQRQVNSSLYERLAISKDKSEVLRLAQEGQTIEKPADILKNPITLEFLGLKHETVYSETKLESAIIDKMQEFLLEMGKGFLFEKRQRRFTFDCPLPYKSDGL